MPIPETVVSNCRSDVGREQIDEFTKSLGHLFNSSIMITMAVFKLSSIYNYFISCICPDLLTLIKYLLLNVFA